MLYSQIKTACLSAAVAVAAVLGGVGSAQAAVYTGTWDPGYGTIFPDLGWKASATFDVPDACLGQADGTYQAIGNCAAFTFLTAQVDFYNFTADPNPNTSPVLESFILNPIVNVTGIDIGSGQLTGLATSFFDNFVPSGASSSIAGNGAFSFSLILLGGTDAQLVYASPVTASPGCAFIPVRGTRCGVSQNVAVGVFAPVPEPGIYALMFGGLGIVGFLARRRRR